MKEIEKSEDKVILGQRFGRWKIIANNYYHPNCHEPHFVLRCECGQLRPLPKKQILSGESTSCGCDQVKKVPTGLTRKTPSALKRQKKAKNSI